MNATKNTSWFKTMVASSCKTLGEGAFYRCFSLEQITFEGE